MYMYLTSKSYAQIYFNFVDVTWKSLSKRKMDEYSKLCLLNWLDFFISQIMIFDPNNNSGFIGNLRYIKLQIKSC
jgi:hypothetical protein